MQLSTSYMGLDLSTPIVVSSCPLSESIDNILKMEDAGAGAVVLFSLFEEQIKSGMRGAPPHPRGESAAEPPAYFPDNEAYRMGGARYLELIQQAKTRTNLPIIASLNGITDSGWVNYARLMEEAGADAIEINVFYLPADMQLNGRDVERLYEDIVARVTLSVGIPVAVKLNPYFSAMGSMAARIEQVGAKGLVLFNRFYQPDFDIDALRVVPSLEYSNPDEIRLPLLWIAFLSGRINASLAASTGVQSASEVIKYLLAGADIAMTASALYKHGIDYIQTMVSDLGTWMEKMEFDSVDAFKGLMNQKNVLNPSAYERANYIRVLGNTE